MKTASDPRAALAVECVHATLTRPDAHHLIDGKHEDFYVTDFPGLGRALDRLDDLGGLLIVDDHLTLPLCKSVDDVLTAPVVTRSNDLAVEPLNHVRP